MTRKEVDQQRLLKLKQDVENLKLRFPIATIARCTGIDKGNISRMLNGKTSCSDSFMKKFYAVYTDLLNAENSIPPPNEPHAKGKTKSAKLKAIASTLSDLAATLNSLA